MISITPLSSIVQNENMINEVEYTKDLGDLVNLITSGKFKIPTPDKTTQNPNIKYDTIEIELIENEAPSDSPKNVYNDIITKFVTAYFYRSDEITFNFFKLINDIFTIGLNTYIEQNKLPKDCLSFVFKGGNILRLIIDTYFNDLPGVVSDLFKSLLKKNFTKSDADFQINVKNLMEKKEDGKNYTKTDGTIYSETDMDTIQDKVTDLAYLLLYRIRNIVLSNLDNYIDYYKLNNYGKKRLLHSIFNKFNKLDKSKLLPPYNNANLVFTNIIFDDLVVNNSSKNQSTEIDEKKDIFGITTKNNSRKDFSVVAGKSKKNIKATLLTTIPYLFQNNEIPSNMFDTNIDKNVYKDRDSTNFYISANKSIPDFNLVRIKINMMAEYTLDGMTHLISVPGEYIDISIPHWKNTSSYFHDGNITTYSSKNIDENDNVRELIFKSYSINSIIDDLIYILFINSNFPWDDNKYDKRLIRILMFCAIDLFESKINDEKKISMLESIMTCNSNIIKNYVEAVKNTEIFSLAPTSNVMPPFPSDYKDSTMDNSMVTYYYNKLCPIVHNLLSQYIKNFPTNESKINIDVSVLNNIINSKLFPSDMNSTMIEKTIYHCVGIWNKYNNGISGKIIILPTITKSITFTELDKITIEINKIDKVLDNTDLMKLKIVKFYNEIMLSNSVKKQPPHRMFMFHDKLYDGIIKRLQIGEKSDDIGKCIDMLKIINSTLEVILHAMKKNKVYKKREQSIIPNKHELISLSHSSFNKYMKYKLKFLTLQSKFKNL